MIKSVNHKGLREIWESGKSSKIPFDQLNKIRQMLEVIDNAQKVSQDFEFFRVGKFIHLKENGKATGA